MWLKFAAIATIVFHRADIANAMERFSKYRAVDYWLRGSAHKFEPLQNTWTAKEGSALLGGASMAPTTAPKSQVPTGLPQDYVPAKHMATGLKPDHPANREYK